MVQYLELLPLRPSQHLNQGTIYLAKTVVSIIWFSLRYALLRPEIKSLWKQSIKLIGKIMKRISLIWPVLAPVTK
ncbi:Uncharacterized protein HZ326_13914 [Fusarium oxysporum f. sp. albedinis]|jgi:hypothetical protein|nr:Uncharacterized protein HZ326_13914 [Fusarium oxysporum f. sp. albedinis]